MKLALCLVALLLLELPVPASSLVQTSGAEVLATPADARWEVAQAAAEVGEPFEATLIVRHTPGGRVALDAAQLDEDTSWIALAAPVLSPSDSSAETRYVWQLASLEPGERELPELELTIDLPSGGKTLVSFAPAKMSFASALAPQEDAPREPRDFRPVADESAALSWPWILAAGALALAAGAVAWRALRRKDAPAPPPTVAQRIEALAQRDLSRPQAVRELHYELTALVRAEFDARERAERAALTDEEWLAQAAVSLASEQAAELELVLRASREVKYGPAEPTEWAVKETLERALRLVRGAGQATRSAA